MKDVIDEDVEKDWSQNGSLRHTFEDWLKITFEIVEDYLASLAVRKDFLVSQTIGKHYLVTHVFDFLPQCD